MAKCLYKGLGNIASQSHKLSNPKSQTKQFAPTNWGLFNKTTS